MNDSSNRKPEAKIAHIDACLSHEAEYLKTSGFERYDFVNQAGSEIALNEISLKTNFLGKNLTGPLMIAPMTGGVERAFQLNRMWARACEHFG